MGRLDELERKFGATADESMGKGRGTGAPRTTAAAASAVPARLQGVVRARDVAAIPVAMVGPDPDQPREEFEPESLGRLAESMKSKGQLQPIRVRWDEPAQLYRIVCGERRWRAARMAGLASITAVIVESEFSAAETLTFQLIENALREDLRPIEQARAYRKLMDANGWKVTRVAEELAVHHGTISRALALLDLPVSIRGQVEQGTLSPATAYEISKADPDAQEDLAACAAHEKLTRSEVVEAVRAGGTARAKPRKAEYRAPNRVKLSASIPAELGDDALAAALRSWLKDLARSRSEAA
jgi:ParB family chromosome partitioning protein